MPETTDQKSILSKLEKSNFWRWILVIAAIIGIVSGIYTFIDKKGSTLNATSYIFTTDVTTIVLAVIFLVISGIIVLTAS